jgi:hypothetical protein
MRRKFTEMVSYSLQVASTLSLAQSSSDLLDMSLYEKAIISCVVNKPLDVTTANFPITVTIYESTASTWNGAVAVALPAFSGTAACSSASTGWKQFEVDVKDLTLANNMRYIGARVACWTKSDMTVIVERYNASYEPVD